MKRTQHDMPADSDGFSSLMTLKEVAVYLCMHEMTVYKLIKRSSIPAMKLGGQWRFKKDALDRWWMLV